MLLFYFITVYIAIYKDNILQILSDTDFQISMAYLNIHCILKYFGIDIYVMCIECVFK